ncbi:MULTISPECIES: hypothetical protein, partial [unclassified Acinetobacter]
PQNDVTLKMPAFEWVHVQLHQQKGMISLSPPTICNSAQKSSWWRKDKLCKALGDVVFQDDEERFGARCNIGASHER